MAATNPADADEARKAELVIASHLLVDQEVLDSFGHISVRSASNPQVFFMPRAMPPALVQSEDIIAISVETGELIDPKAPRPNGERFIHSETYKARPDVHCVIHSHSMLVIPFGIAGVPLRPVVAQAGFLPLKTPVFEIRDAWGDAKERGVQVRSLKHATVMAKVQGDAPAVILRGHGHNIVADSIRRAVVRAAYININARVQMDAVRLSGGGEIVTLDQKELDYHAIENFDVDRPWDNFVRIMKGKESKRSPSSQNE